MPNSKSIIFAFKSVRETTYAFVFSVGMENITSASQYLMSVCLVANVPNNLVKWCIKCIVQGNGQLNNSKTGTKMPWIRANNINDIGFYLFLKISNRSQ